MIVIMKNKKILMLFAKVVTVLTILTVIIWNINNPKMKIVAKAQNQFDVDYSLQIFITLADKVKSVNPNIVKATRTALFERNSYLAKFSHYNSNQKEYINIFEVIKTGENSWEVRFREKSSDKEEYDNRFYSSATVTQEAFGRFVGYISVSSPKDDGKETY